MTPDDLPLSRVDELLADLALQGLSEAERAELESLIGDASLHPDARALEQAVAQVNLALSAASLDEPPLPDHLRARLEQSADAFFSDQPSPVIPFRLRLSRVGPWLGWLTAAAALIFALLPPGDRAKVPRVPGPTPSVETRLASTPAQRFQATTHPLATGGSGSIAWNGDLQEGLMTIQGLAATEPASGIYQLWIFDETRDERFPVDGGTFRIDDAARATQIRVKPSLQVRKPTLFAITLEPPGGVVVSDRKRIMMTASLSR